MPYKQFIVEFTILDLLAKGVQMHVRLTSYQQRQLCMNRRTEKQTNEILYKCTIRKQWQEIINVKRASYMLIL